MAQQVHVRMAAQVAVVRAGQRGRRGREDDVVAVAVETGEAAVACRRLALRQRLQPRAAAAHLLRVRRQAEARQPGAAVRRADRHHAVHARIAVVRAHPGADRQPAHAVADQQRAPAGGPRHAPHRILDQRHVGVDRAEDRLQVQRDAGHALRDQPRPPGVPEAAVADEAVYQDQAAPAAGIGRQMVRMAAPAPGHLPAEDAEGAQRLGAPGAQQFARARARRLVVPVQAALQREFQRHRRQVQQCQAQGQRQQPPGAAPQQPQRQRAAHAQRHQQRHRLQQPRHRHVWIFSASVGAGALGKRAGAW